MLWQVLKLDEQLIEIVSDSLAFSGLRARAPGGGVARERAFYARSRAARAAEAALCVRQMSALR